MSDYVRDMVHNIMLNIKQELSEMLIDRLYYARIFHVKDSTNIHANDFI